MVSVSNKRKSAGSCVTVAIQYFFLSAAYIHATDASVTLNMTTQPYGTTDAYSLVVTENDNHNDNNSDSKYSHGNVSGDEQEYEYNNYYNDEYMYPGYSFERPVYLYIWEILVVVTFLVNIIVILVLLRRKMRNATNMILAAIAISDSLTGLVTLPTYIMVYLRYDPLSDYDYNDFPVNKSSMLNQSDYNQHSHYQFSYDNLPYDSYPNTRIDPNISKSDYQENNQTMDYVTQPPVDAYILSKSLCQGFMISKYFLSKSFHTVSIFLTLFLAIQRYVSVAFPFKSQSIFTASKTVGFCVIIFLVSPVLHSYHLSEEKAVDGLCQWELSGDGCGHGCIYLWIIFLLRHFIPCFALTTFTFLFIKHLRSGMTNLRRMDSSASQVSKRKEENRRISIIVTAIVVVFLVPEIPYGIFLFISAITKTSFNGEGINLERNRAIHMGYELLLLLSFHANFYIYTFLNRKFRKCLYRTFVKPVQRFIGGKRRLSVTSITTSTSRRTTRRTECASNHGAYEMKDMQSSSSEKSVTMVTKLKQSVSQDISKSCSNSDSHETEALNANV